MDDDDNGRSMDNIMMSVDNEGVRFMDNVDKLLSLNNDAVKLLEDNDTTLCDEIDNITRHDDNNSTHLEDISEDWILLQREYKKHIFNIKKSKIREKHFKYKNVGYTQALEDYKDDLVYLSILFGYLENEKINLDEFIDLLSSGMSKKKINITDLTIKIINNSVNTIQKIKDYIQNQL